MNNPSFRILIAGWVWALLFLALPSGQSYAAPGRPEPEISPSEVIALVNSLRASNGLPPYSANSILMQVAQSHADYMAATGNITHYSADGSRPFQRALAAGYSVAGDLSLGGWFSENIIGSPGMTPQGAVSAWQGDAPHLNTMLSPNLFDVGAGVSKNGNTVYYVVDAGAAGASSGNPGLPGTITAPGTPLVSQFIVPVTLNTPGPDGLVYHEVQYGQTLWSIAIAYETKIDEIKRLNSLTSNDIQPGQNLLIKQGPTPAPPTATSGSTQTATTPSTTAETVPPETSTSVADATSTLAPVLEQNAASNPAIFIILGALVFAALGTWLGTRRAE